MALLDSTNGKIAVGIGAAIGGVSALWYVAAHRPKLVLDYNQLQAGGYAVWNAANLDPNHVYVIGPVLPDGSLYYNPNTDTIAGTDSSHGVQTITSDMVGATVYVIYDSTTGNVVASTAITVVA